MQKDLGSYRALYLAVRSLCDYVPNRERYQAEALGFFKSRLVSGFAGWQNYTVEISDFPAHSVFVRQ